MSADFTKLERACADAEVSDALAAYMDALQVQSSFLNGPRAFLRSYIARKTQMDDEFVQVSCEEHLVHCDW